MATTDTATATRPEVNPRPEHAEGSVARTIEQQTAKLPSDLFLWAAGASIIGSLLFQAGGRKEDALFVGQWAPTFLILGLYNKLVKLEGHDRAQNWHEQLGEYKCEYCESNFSLRSDLNNHRAHCAAARRVS